MKGRFSFPPLFFPLQIGSPQLFFFFSLTLPVRVANFFPKERGSGPLLGKGVKFPPVPSLVFSSLPFPCEELEGGPLFPGDIRIDDPPLFLQTFLKTRPGVLSSPSPSSSVRGNRPLFSCFSQWMVGYVPFRFFRSVSFLRRRVASSLPSVTGCASPFSLQPLPSLRF